MSFALPDPFGETTASTGQVYLYRVPDVTQTVLPAVFFRGPTQAERARAGTRAGVLHMAEEGRRRLRPPAPPRRRHQQPKLRPVR